MTSAIQQDNCMNFTDNNHSSGVLDKFRHQRDSQRFCDIVLHVQGASFPAHKNVLAACSPYFDSILNNLHGDEVLQIQCENCNAFGLVLNYMYTGNVVIDKNNVIELLKLANQFFIAKLKNYCAEYLHRYLDIYNCLVIHDLASISFYNMPSLEKNSLQFIQNNLENILNLPEVCNLSHSRIEWLLSGKHIVIPNDRKLKFLADWIYCNNDRELYFKDLLKFVNFKDVDKNFILGLFQSHALFKENHRCSEDYRERVQTEDFDIEWCGKETKNLENILDDCNNPGENLLTVAMAAAITEDGDVLKDSHLDENSQVSIQKLVEDTFTGGYSELSSSDNEDTSDEKLTRGLFSFKKKNLPIKMRIARSVKQQNCAALLRRKVFSESVGNVSVPDSTISWKDSPDTGLGSPVASSEEENRDICEGSVTSSDIDQSISDDIIQCGHCSFATSSPSRMEVHNAKVHSKNIIYTCCLCNYSANWNKDYYQHMKTHFPGPPYCCDNCSYTCDRIQPVLAHRMKHTDEKPFQCSICSYKCRTKNNLIAHVRSHTGERPFECGHCGRSFAIKSTLDQHLVTHSDDRPYLCDICGFSTKYQSHLIAHKRIHTGDVYTCQFPHCTYFSPKKSQLKAHMRTHMAIRSHICTTCHRGFVEKSHLVRHERIHLEEKPFKCDECDYGSSRRDKLKEHKIKHHHTTLINSKWNSRGRKTNKQIVEEQLQNESRQIEPPENEVEMAGNVSKPSLHGSVLGVPYTPDDSTLPKVDPCVTSQSKHQKYSKEEMASAVNTGTLVNLESMCNSTPFALDYTPTSHSLSETVASQAFINLIPYALPPAMPAVADGCVSIL